MSFFDEADEPTSPPRSRPRRPSGRGRPPRDQQAIQTRRTVAVVVIVVVIVLLAVGIHSCDVSQTNSALRDYANNVSSIIGQSNATGSEVFHALSGGGGANRGQSLQAELISLLASSTSPSADSELQRAENLSVPGQMQTAQQYLVFALRMRRDGLKVIADQIQQALGTTTNRDAITQLATATAHFYASDVIYKSYAAPAIAGQLNAAGIQVGGTNGPTINGGQFLTDLAWLQPTFIAQKLGSRVSGTNLNTAGPGPRGDALTSVAIGSNTMAPGVTNHTPANPAPTFTLSVTNGGAATEYDVGCKVSVTGLSDTGRASVAQIPAGQTGTCNVTLPTAPTPGTYSVTATVAPVPGETNLTNNSRTFTLQFQ